MNARSDDSLSSALERICFLEWRLEQMESVVADERRTVRDLREQVAEGAQREASAARRIADLEERLAEARREMVVLGDRTAHADAERTSLERRIEAGGRETARDVAELCRRLEHEQERAEQKSRSLEQARERLASLERARESFFARLIEWQKMSRADDVDLAEFIAELRAEIARLAAENEAGQEREDGLRDRLAKAHTEPERDESTPLFLSPPIPTGLPSEAIKSAPPEPESKARTPLSNAIGLDDARAALESLESDAKRVRAQRLVGDLASPRLETRLSAARHLLETAGPLAAPALVSAVRMAVADEERIAMLELLGRTRAPLARVSIEPAIVDQNPFVRMAALEAKLALATSAEVTSIAQVGLTDADARVRRRTVLAVKAAAKQDVAMLLLPLTADPDPQARRTACAALAGERSPEAVKALMRALDDEVESVRTAAAQSLGKMRREMRHGAG